MHTLVNIRPDLIWYNKKQWPFSVVVPWDLQGIEL